MVRRCVKLCTGQEYAAKIINTKKLSARGKHIHCISGFFITDVANSITAQQLSPMCGVPSGISNKKV